MYLFLMMLHSIQPRIEDISSISTMLDYFGTSSSLEVNINKSVVVPIKKLKNKSWVVYSDDNLSQNALVLREQTSWMDSP